MNSQATTSGEKGKPRLGIDVTSAVTQRAGIGRYTRELVQALVKYDNAFEYVLFSAKPKKPTAIPLRINEKSQVQIRQAPFSEQWLYRLWHRLRIPLPVQLITGQLDLFYSPDFVLPPVQGDIPTVLTVHDLSFIHYPETFTKSLTNYLNRVVPRSVHRASHILADSQATKDDLLTIWGVPDEKVSVIYSGVDRSFRPSRDKEKLAELRDKYELGTDPYILSVGTIQPRKNFRMLIRAFKSVAENYPHRLIIAGGKGWLYEETFQEVKTQGLENKVQFIGFVDDKDLPALYSEATLFAFPSLYEGFGLPILEAMACGVPVVISDASCMPEIAGEAALALAASGQDEWATGIQNLLEDPSRRMKMVAAGFLRARQFSWRVAAEQLADVFNNLLEKL
jgi:glycosyltransferase involved in cell wall biosynthesis